MRRLHCGERERPKVRYSRDYTEQEEALKISRRPVMSYIDERRCIGCGDTEEQAHLERCLVCGKWFCPDCAFKQTGRRFCTPGCARDFFWGDTEEEDETEEIPEPEY